MVDPRVIRRRLREIDERMAALSSIREAGRDDFLRDPIVRSAAERNLQIAIQAALEIAIHILSEDAAETPQDYAGAFQLLPRIGVLDSELANRLASAARLRNVLVHMYVDVDPELVWAALESLEDLERFAAAVERYLTA